MAGLREIAQWETEVYQIEENDPVHGGAEGITNKPAKQLANRTLYLKQLLEAAGQKLLPKTLNATSTNHADATGHTHEIAKGNTSQVGIVRLTNDTGLDSETLALSAKGAKKLAQQIAQTQQAQANYIQHSKKSSATNSNSEDTVATSKAVKTAYDLANGKQSPATTLAGYGIQDFSVKNLTTEDLNSITKTGVYGQAQNNQATNARHYPENNKAGSLNVGLSVNGVMQTYTTYDNHNIYIRNKIGVSTWSVWKRVNSEGLPIGAILSFPRAISHPQGFLQCNGSTFAQNTYPDLYRALGNSNRLPNLTRSDIGMTAYFAVDNIPEGWIAFDDIATQVTQQRYPELYRYLTTKYGAIANVPKIADRFIRNAGEGLRVGQIQNDQIGKHVHNIGLYNNDLTVDYHSNFFKSFTLDTSIRTVMSYDADTFNNGWATPKDTSPFATGGDENRPKALVLKFCIKAKDQFDDAVFWIKAFGEVENAGTLNAGRLAQDLQQQQHQLEQAQRDVASVQQAQTQTSTELTRLAQQQNIVKKSRKVWQGNITQNSTNIIQLSESILDKTLVFFMQISQAHTLQDNNDVYVASVYIDGALMECNGKKYARGAYRINDWNSLNIEIIDNNRIRIIDVGSLYVKQINAR